MSPRTLWPVLALCLLVLTLAVSRPSAAATPSLPDAPRRPAAPQVTLASLDITPLKEQYALGDVVTVTVRLANLTDFFGGELRWSFDPGAVQVLDADPNRPLVQLTPGDLLPPPSVIANPREGQANNQTGKILFGGARLNLGAYNGNGSLVSVTFKVIGICGDILLPLNPETLSLSTPSAEAIPFESTTTFNLRTSAACPNHAYLPLLDRTYTWPGR